jgi:hypothetical protein
MPTFRRNIPLSSSGLKVETKTEKIIIIIIIITILTAL